MFSHESEDCDRDKRQQQRHYSYRDVGHLANNFKVSYYRLLLGSGSIIRKTGLASWIKPAQTEMTESLPILTARELDASAAFTGRSGYETS